jgi:hypothetical protein
LSVTTSGGWAPKLVCSVALSKQERLDPEDAADDEKIEDPPRLPSIQSCASLK